MTKKPSSDKFYTHMLRANRTVARSNVRIIIQIHTWHMFAARSIAHNCTTEKYIVPSSIPENPSGVSKTDKTEWIPHEFPINILYR